MEVPSSEYIGKAAKRVLPFEAVVLVLQGGGALGAYQAGVFQAIHESDIQLRWLCTTSIGAINGALIVGNAAEKRVERLREFWEVITEPPIGLLAPRWLSDFPWAGNEETRAWTKSEVHQKRLKAWFADH